ncbi:MAG: HAD family hydrolase [Kiritimatiellae bacterium]|nr:HAD family hydrolase [Kiritimatiellia bacterium]
MFDLDGTLAMTDSANSAAYRVALRRTGIQGLPRLAGRMTADSIRRALPEMPSAWIDEVMRRKANAYCGELWRLRPGPAVEAFRRVLAKRSQFDKVVLLSDGNERRVMETLRYYGWDRHFDEIVCNGGRGNKYANYFKAFDSDPAACVVWENEDGQVHSAIAAGVKLENIRKVG